MLILFALKALAKARAYAEAGKGVIEVVKFLRESHDLIEKMKDENRDPTPEEWDALNVEIAESQAILHRNEKPDA